MTQKLDVSELVHYVSELRTMATFVSTTTNYANRIFLCKQTRAVSAEHVQMSGCTRTNGITKFN